MLTPIRIFEGAFGGATVYSNAGSLPNLTKLTRRDLMVFSTEFISPGAVRSAIKREQGDKYRSRKESQMERSQRQEDRRLEEDELAVRKVFA